MCSKGIFSTQPSWEHLSKSTVGSSCENFYVLTPAGVGIEVQNDTITTHKPVGCANTPMNAQAVNIPMNSQAMEANMRVEQAADMEKCTCNKGEYTTMTWNPDENLPIIEDLHGNISDESLLLPRTGKLEIHGDYNDSYTCVTNRFGVIKWASETVSATRRVHVNEGVPHGSENALPGDHLSIMNGGKLKHDDNITTGIVSLRRDPSPGNDREESDDSTIYRSGDGIVDGDVNSKSEVPYVNVKFSTDKMIALPELEPLGSAYTEMQYREDVESNESQDANTVTVSGHSPGSSLSVKPLCSSEYMNYSIFVKNQKYPHSEVNGNNLHLSEIEEGDSRTYMNPVGAQQSLRGSNTILMPRSQDKMEVEAPWYENVPYVKHVYAPYNTRYGFKPVDHTAEINKRTDQYALCTCSGNTFVDPLSQHSAQRNNQDEDRCTISKEETSKVCDFHDISVLNNLAGVDGIASENMLCQQMSRDKNTPLNAGQAWGNSERECSGNDANKTDTHSMGSDKQTLTISKYSQPDGYDTPPCFSKSEKVNQDSPCSHLNENKVHGKTLPSPVDGTLQRLSSRVDLCAIENQARQIYQAVTLQSKQDALDDLFSATDSQSSIMEESSICGSTQSQISGMCNVNKSINKMSEHGNKTDFKLSNRFKYMQRYQISKKSRSYSSFSSVFGDGSVDDNCCHSVDIHNRQLRRKAGIVKDYQGSLPDISENISLMTGSSMRSLTSGSTATHRISHRNLSKRRLRSCGRNFHRSNLLVPATGKSRKHIHHLTPRHPTIVLKVYLDTGGRIQTVQVPIDTETTCLDVINHCRPSEEIDCQLAELWRGCERFVGDDERPYNILQQWGIHREEVQFYLRRVPQINTTDQEEEGRRIRRRNGVRDDGNEMLPSGVDLTLSELQEMATRQQQQIEAQQQMLVAKEQRLKYLKQQELRHQQIAAENERLRTLREKVEAQELKLKKLRALRGQVNEQKGNNSGLTAELETIKALFNEKEKELSVAVTKVEELTRQLESLRNGSSTNDNRHNSAALLELEKLRKDLMARNKLNETQNMKLSSQREILLQRKQEMSHMDERIAELQARLRKKRMAAAASNSDNLLNLANRMRSNSMGNKPGGGRTQGTNVAAVEPYIKHEPTDGPDDRFGPIKTDPKYQTLPYNIKFLSDEKKEKEDQSEKPVKNNEALNRTEGGNNGNNNSKPPSPLGRPASLDFLPKETIHNKPEYKPSVGHSIAYEALEETLKKSDPKPAPAKPPVYGMSNFAPRPYGSTFSTSLVNRSGISSSVPNSATSSPSKLSDSVISTPGTGPLTSTPIVTGGKSQTAHEQHDETREIFITGAPVVMPPSNSSYSMSGNVSRIASQFQPPSGVTSSVGAPTSAGRMQPLYQIASSRPQPPVQPQRTLDPSSSVGGLSSSSSSSPNTVTNDPQLQSFGAGRDSQSSISPASTSATFVSSSSGVNTSQMTGNRSATSSQQLDRTLTASTPSPNDTVDGSKISQISHQKEDSKDSQNKSDDSVSSALSVLKTSHTSSKQPATRYTPKGAIANTYLNKLGTSSMDKYRQNMSSIYRDFINDQTYQSREQRQVDDQKTESPTATVHPLGLEDVSPSESPPLLPGANSHDAFKASPAHDLDAERLHYRPNVPKLRRRSSSGETDDLRQHNTHQQRRPGNEDEDSVFVTSNEPSNNKLEVIRVDTIQDSYNNNDVKTDNNNSTPAVSTSDTFQPAMNAVQIVRKKTNLKSRNSVKSSRRVSFDPLALLLDASLEGELELVKRTAGEVPDPSAANDEGITALHNAICAGHYEIVKYLVEFGCNVNSPDSDGWTPLHCAASCNNLPMVKILVEHGACIFATTISDQETAAEKCEEDEDGYDGCSEYLYSIQEKLGIINKGVVYAVFDYLAQNPDELSFKNLDSLVVLRKGDEREKEWWWARKSDNEGYIPRNLLGLFPRVPLKSRHDS